MIKTRRPNFLKVRAVLAPKLNTIGDQPPDALALIKRLERYADAYAGVDVTSCPEDFRKQFYADRQATSVSVSALQAEYLYLERHPGEDPAKGGVPEMDAVQMMNAANAAMENAISQRQELKVIARKYDVDWP